METSRTFAGKFLSRLDRIDRQQIESYLQKVIQAKTFLEVIFNRMVEGIIVTDISLRVLFMNLSACRLLGLKDDPGLFAGKNLTTLITIPGLLQRIIEFDPARGDVLSEEINIQKPRTATLLVSFLPVLSEPGKTESVVFMINDVTEEKRASQAQQQKERITSLATLTAGLAHEIRNPLNSLQIHAQLLKKYLTQPKKGPEQELHERSLKSIDVILEEIERLSDIVSHFLSVVRPAPVNLEPGDVNTIIRHVLEIVAPVFEERKIILEASLEPTITEARLNERGLAQAFFNIINNALDALEGRPEPALRITSRLEETSIVVDFMDNGCGIPEKDLERIYDPYFTTKFNGTGLGLMMVHRVIGEHGGMVGIRSREGEGTTVSITIPLSKRPMRYLPGMGEENRADTAENDITITEQDYETPNIDR